MAVYLVYSLFSAALCALVLRSVTGELFGRAVPHGEAPPASSAACVEDVERLFAALAARALDPAPGGLGSETRALDWDRWSQRWEDEVAAVSARCRLDAPPDQPRRQLAAAVEALEDLRRELARSGQETSREARRVRESLDAARAGQKRR